MTTPAPPPPRASVDSRGRSIVRGPALASEPGVGALTIGGYAREVTARHGPAEAVVLDGPYGRVSWSYDELWRQSMAVARALVGAGAGKGARVGILMTNRPEYISSLFGVALAGGVAVSLSTFSTTAELEHLLQAGAVAILLYDHRVLAKDFTAALAELEPQVATAAPGRLASERFPYLQRLVALDSVTAALPAVATGAVELWRDFLAGGEGVQEARVLARLADLWPADPGAIFFSSGTTNLPKGIVHAQRAMPVQWWRWPRVMDIDPAYGTVRVWTANGFFWSGIVSQTIGYAFSTGGAIVLQPLLDADEALALIGRERVTFAIGRPHQWARLQDSPAWPTADLSSLHYVTYGEKIFEHPTTSSDWQLCPAYGNTETMTINVAVGANTPEAEHRGSFGWPLPGNVLKIIDPDSGEIVPVGERGEMAVKGPTLMSGYVGKTAEECFDEEGFFLTGDGGYVDGEGRLYWEGRLNDIIKTGGANVSPVEVDTVLAAVPGVKIAATVGVPDPLLGEAVVSCIVPAEGAVLQEEALRALLRERLASYKTPRRILFMQEGEVEVTGNGKVRTKALRELAARRLAEA